MIKTYSNSSSGKTKSLMTLMSPFLYSKSHHPLTKLSTILPGGPLYFFFKLSYFRSYKSIAMFCPGALNPASHSKVEFFVIIWIKYHFRSKRIVFEYQWFGSDREQKHKFSHWIRNFGPVHRSTSIWFKLNHVI